MAVRQDSHLNLRAVFLGGGLKARETAAEMGRANLKHGIRRYLPEILPLEEFDHAEWQNLLVLLIVLRRDLGADRNVSLVFAVLYPLLHRTEVSACLRPTQ